MQRGIHAFIIAIFAATVAAGAFAAPDPPPDPDKEKDKKLEQARQALDRGQWQRAESLLAAALAEDPANAESHNLYAYAIRKGPSPRMELVFRHYNEALRLRPTHLGAHEYLGEAYLMVGNLAKAREHLAVLERLCGACDEQGKLARAVSTAETQQAAK